MHLLRAAFVTLTVAAGCASGARVLLPGNLDAQQIATLLAQHPLAENQPLRVIPLARSEHLSYHLVRIRDREAPHLHARHDLAVTLIGGRGELHAGGTTVAMGRGDSAVVPSGTPHYFVNTGRDEAIAIVTFAPPLTAPDSVPVAAQE